GVYIYIFDTNTTRLEPAALYEAPISGIKFIKIDCGVSYLYLKIDFLSSGIEINVLPMNIDIPNPLIDQFSIATLPYGGYLLSGIGTFDNGETIIEGFIFNDEDIVYRWDLPFSTVTNFLIVSKILRNNTYILAQLEEKRNWALVTTDLYKFEEEKDHGYENFHIDTKSPNINDKLYSKQSPLQLNILMNVDGNLTTINIKLLNCTLNQLGSRYYVSIENNFVRDRIYKEPLYGVKDHVWSFITSPLPPKKKIFRDRKGQELADAIPVSRQRITTNEKAETDTSVLQRQILLPIEIKKDDSFQERTVRFAIIDLDQLITNKPITVIGSGEASQHLDEIYGYRLL
ncbi:2390_t:CDS:2, partial [Funneliformis mosseae]